MLPAGETMTFHSCGHLVARLETTSCYVAVDSAGTPDED